MNATTSDMRAVYLEQRSALLDRIGHDYNSWDLNDATQAAEFFQEWVRLFMGHYKAATKLVEVIADQRKEINRLNALQDFLRPREDG